MFKIWCILENIYTEAVFTNIYMNNEWIVYFLQNTRCIQKGPRLKLYLLRKACEMNAKLTVFKIPGVLENINTDAVFTETNMNNEGTLIFFKVLGIFEKYRDWRYIYHDTDSQWLQRLFSKKNTRYIQKVSRQKLYLPRIVKLLQNMRIFKEISRLKLHQPQEKLTMNKILIFSRIFSICQWLKLFFRYSMMLRRRIFIVFPAMSFFCPLIV